MSEHLKIIQTEDGSHSLYHERLNESYHSFHGAWSESMHVFIDKGLRYWRIKEGLPKEANIFEVGFGTGLNALLAAQFAETHQILINYHTIEPFPLEWEMIKALNFGQKAGDQGLFESIHQAAWDEKQAINAYFTLHKSKENLQSITLAEATYDLVFYDAFAPSKQPELWEKPLLEKAYLAMNNGAALVTYCARGQFKRDLKEVGFEVETLPGPPGKKEMIRANKD